MKLKSLVASMLVITTYAGSAHAQSDKPWNGLYGGVNIGGARYQGCASGTLELSADHVPVVGSFDDSSCSGTAFVGGVQLGEDFQFTRMVVGVAADLDAWGVEGHRRTLKNTAAFPPPGAYVYSGSLSPSGLAIVGARIGYAGDLWLPYLRAGAVLAARPRDRRLTFTPTGSANSTASFSEGANFASTGWAAGMGTEIGLNGAWSITAEYLHVTLGKGADTASTCSGSPSACAAFSGLSLDTQHGGFSANVFRIGVNYWFGYWEP